MRFLVLDGTSHCGFAVTAPSYFDVSKHASRLWSMWTTRPYLAPLLVELEDEHRYLERYLDDDSFQLEWRGTDAGRVAKRTLWTRAREADGSWSDWVEMERF